MPTSDVFGREYAKLSDILPGDLVQFDDGFTCLELNEIGEVHEDESGLYVLCFGDLLEDDSGPHGNGRFVKHYLDGQLDHQDDTDALIGVYPYTHS